MIRLDSRGVLGVGFVVVAFVAACSSAPPPPNDLSNDGDDGSNAQTSKKAPPKNNGSSGSGGQQQQQPPAPSQSDADGGTSSTPPPTGSNKCAAEASAQGCFDCCVGNNGAALDQAYKVFDTCACQTPGTCKAACGSNYCAGQQPTAACEQCLDNATQCEQQADQACAANAGCKAIQDCVSASQCDAKQ